MDSCARINRVSQHTQVILLSPHRVSATSGGSIRFFDLPKGISSACRRVLSLATVPNGKNRSSLRRKNVTLGRHEGRWVIFVDLPSSKWLPKPTIWRFNAKIHGAAVLLGVGGLSLLGLRTSFQKNAQPESASVSVSALQASVNLETPPALTTATLHVPMTSASLPALTTEKNPTSEVSKIALLGSCGIKNPTSTTCYINTFVQLVLSIPEFIVLLRKIKDQRSGFIGIFQDILRAVESRALHNPVNLHSVPSKAHNVIDRILTLTIGEKNTQDDTGRALGKFFDDLDVITGFDGVREFLDLFRYSVEERIICATGKSVLKMSSGYSLDLKLQESENTTFDAMVGEYCNEKFVSYLEGCAPDGTDFGTLERKTLNKKLNKAKPLERKEIIDQLKALDIRYGRDIANTTEKRFTFQMTPKYLLVTVPLHNSALTTRSLTILGQTYAMKFACIKLGGTSGGHWYAHKLDNGLVTMTMNDAIITTNIDQPVVQKSISSRGQIFLFEKI